MENLGNNGSNDNLSNPNVNGYQSPEQSNLTMPVFDMNTHNNSANSNVGNDPNTNVSGYRFHEHFGLTMLDNGMMNMNGHDSVTRSTSVQNTPAIEFHPFGSTTSLEVNPNINSNQWLTLAPPESNVAPSDHNLTDVQLNHITVRSNGLTLNLFLNTPLRINPVPHYVDGTRVNPSATNTPPQLPQVNPTAVTAPPQVNPVATNTNTPPRTVAINFGGSWIQATPVELNLMMGFGSEMSTLPGSQNGYPTIAVSNDVNRLLERQELDNQASGYEAHPVHQCECPCRTCMPMSRDSDSEDSDEAMEDAEEDDNNEIENDNETEETEDGNVDGSEYDDEEDTISDPGHFMQSILNLDPENMNIVLSELDNMSYEQILAIQEEIGFVSNGVPPHMLELAFKSKKCRPSTSNAKCCICWDEFKAMQELGVLRCGHEFHHDCIKQWLTNRNTCPLCRGNVL